MLLYPKNQLAEVFISLSLLVLVFSNLLNSISIIVLLLLFVFSKKKEYAAGINLLSIIFLLLFLWIALSAYLSIDRVHGFKFLERNLVLVILPFAFSIIPVKNLKIEFVFRTYLRGISIMLSYALIVACYKNSVFNLNNGLPIYKLKSWYFTYHYIASNLNCTAIYLSLYVSFCIILLSLDITKKHRLGLKCSDKYKVGWLLFLLVILVLLSARTIMMATVVILLVIFFIHAKTKRSLNQYFLSLFSILILFFGIIYKNDVLRLRLQGAFTLKENTKYFSGGLSSRIYQWEGILKETIDSNIWLGGGVGDVKSNYSIIYEQTGLDWALKNEFNSHNMYIEYFFSTGLIGLLLLCLIFFFSFCCAFKSKDLRYLIFLLVFCIAGLTESLLNRQYGIIYFTLINSLFYFYHKRLSIENSHTRNSGNTQ